MKSRANVHLGGLPPAGRGLFTPRIGATPDPHRFVQSAPHLARMIQIPAYTFVLACLAAIGLSFLSIHWALTPLCLWLLLLALKIEWDLLSRMLLPPLILVVLVPALGVGLGVPMYISGMELVWSLPCLIMQIVFLLGVPIMYLGYWIARGRVCAYHELARCEWVFDLESKRILLMGGFFFSYDIVRITLGWLSGGLDRGYAGDVVLQQDLGLWTLASLFSRWNTIGFFFLPFLWRRGGAVLRLLLVAGCSYYSVIAFASGSRGLLVYPALFAACGLYFFVDSLRFRPERWAPVVCVVAIGFIYVMDVYRNTSQFRDTKLLDVKDRLAAVRGVAHAVGERQDFASTAGRALIGVSDDIIYELTPDPMPHVGGGDILPSLIWTWVPQILAPDKPYLFDGNEIVVSYTGLRQDRSFATISLGADLYRRFGWGAVPVGFFVAGVVYGVFVRLVMMIFYRISVVAGIMLIVIVLGGLQMGFFSTVLTTWWIWAYDIPKNLIPIGILLFLVSGEWRRGFSHYHEIIRAGR